MEGKESQDILQYKIMWSSDSECIKDEVVDEEDTMVTDMEVDGWPREGRGHRWVKVREAKGWCKGEREELCEVIEAYCDFSTRSGAKARGEIFVRHANWHGIMVDIRESIHEDPGLIVTGWRRKYEKTRGELWEEKERNMEETILTRCSKEVAKIRWTSPKKLYKEEPVYAGLWGYAGRV